MSKRKTYSKEYLQLASKSKITRVAQDLDHVKSYYLWRKDAELDTATLNSIQKINKLSSKKDLYWSFMIPLLLIEKLITYIQQMLI